MENDEINNIQNLQHDKNQFNYPIILIEENENYPNENLNFSSKIKNEIHKEINSTSNKYYIPICRKKGCEGHLKITIDEEKFLIKGKCQKNKEHIFNDIFFEIFEKFYLKENIIQNCFKCSNNLENKYKFVCNECKNIYCPYCFISDIHIKKDIKNLKFISNKCNNCENELINYCTNCGENICLICSKKYDNNKSHENHKIINILDIIPSKNKLNNLKEKIRKKSDYFDSVIKSLEEWQNELNKKIERIKENLKNEIYIIEKLFLNFNTDYMDYTYISNFNEFFNEIDKYNNTFLKQFKEAKNFSEKTKNIFDLILIIDKIDKESEIINKRAKKKELFNNNIIDNFNEKYFLFHNRHDKHICLLHKINGTTLYPLDNTKINFNEEIFSFNYSYDRKKIYACLANKKSIYIINYNPDKNNLELTDEKIEIMDQSHFNKCININNNCLLIIDDYTVYLFSKNDSNLLKFTNENKFTFCEKIYDICIIDDKFAIISQKSKLIFINIENLKIIKEIDKLDCSEMYNNLITFKNYILVNCKKGIAIISSEKQEIVKYVSDEENLGEKKTVKPIDNYIYISYSLGYLLKYSFKENNLVLNKKIEIKSPYVIIHNSNEIFIF